ncbi:PAS domain S-box protein [bacterium]|nr:PAS domain S-box protein [bacterium]
MKYDENFYRNIFDNAVMGIFYSTPDGQHLEVNPALAGIYGYDSPTELLEQLIDIDAQLYVEPGRRTVFLKSVESEGEIHNFESRVYKKDTSIVWISENARAVTDESGRISYFVGTVKDITERKNAEEKLISYQDELRSLAAELSISEERERRRIASELHDSIAQILALLKIKLGALKRDTIDTEYQKQIIELQSLAESAISSTRSLMTEICPPILYEMGLEVAIGWLAEHFTDRFPLEIRVKDNIRPLDLADDLKVLLFQCVRELLMNVVKHADASHVIIQLQTEDAMLCVEVKDDGIGMPADEIDDEHHANSGFGLFNMRERLRYAGGSLEIICAYSQGCCIRLYAPMDLKMEPVNV